MALPPLAPVFGQIWRNFYAKTQKFGFAPGAASAFASIAASFRGSPQGAAAPFARSVVARPGQQACTIPELHQKCRTFLHSGAAEPRRPTI
jgi:hypothetical protein